MSPLPKGTFVANVEEAAEHVEAAASEVMHDFVLQDWHWVLGAFIAILAAFISNIGLNLQKLAHLEIAYDNPLGKTGKKLKVSKQSYVFNSRWISGLMLTILGSVADFAALAFAAQSLVAILGSLTLVCNILIAPLMLNESVSSHDVRAVIMIIAGCTLAVSFGQHSSEVHAFEYFLYMFGRGSMMVYTFTIVMIIGVCWGSIYFIEDNYSKKRRDGGVVYTYETGSRVHSMHRFLYPAISGVVGAQSVLFGKCMAEILKGSVVHGFSAFGHPMTFMVLIMLLACIVTQIKWLNAGLQLFEALYVVPIFQTIWILGSVVGGLIFFDEFSHFRIIQTIFFPLGIFLTILGVIELSKRGDDSSRRSSIRSARSESATTVSLLEHRGDDGENDDGRRETNTTATGNAAANSESSGGDAEEEEEEAGGDDDEAPLLGP